MENLLKKSGVSLQNKLRLVLLYALRYEKESGNMIARFTEMLGAQGASSEQMRLVSLMVEHYGSAMRSGDLFSNKSWLAVQKKNLQRSVKGVQNVYTQHTPYLGQILEKLSKGVLAETLYPYLPSAEAAAGAGAKKAAPTQILVRTTPRPRPPPSPTPPAPVPPRDTRVLQAHGGAAPSPGVGEEGRGRRKCGRMTPTLSPQPSPGVHAGRRDLRGGALRGGDEPGQPRRAHPPRGHVCAQLQYLPAGALSDGRPGRTARRGGRSRLAAGGRRERHRGDGLLAAEP